MIAADADTRSHAQTSRAQSSRAQSSRAQIGLLILTNLIGVAAAVLALMPPVAQTLAYHAFHDGRSWLGIPNAWNVLSNAPFVVIGLLGLAYVGKRTGAGATETTVPQALRAAYAVLFTGVLLTGFGSAYYHWAPDNHTLVWDRLPMTLAFVGLFTAVVGERIDLEFGRRLLVPLAGFGIGSVLWWAAFDDLRPYGIVQFYPILAIPVLMWAFPPRYTGSSAILAALGCYVIGKGLEKSDGTVFAFGQVVSGHSLKHLMAAAGCWFLYRMITSRRPA